MATAISEIDLCTSLRDKPGDTETRGLIEYVKTSCQETIDEVTKDRRSLATKDDLARFLQDIKRDIASSRSETKQEIAGLRSDIKQDMTELRSESKLDMATLRGDMEKGFKEQLRWVIVLLMGFASLIITVIKLL